MAVKIIGRDGQERKQGDTSSWKNSSSKSSGSSSNEAQAAQAAQQQTPAYSKIYQQQNERLQAQIKAVEAERAPSTAVKEESIVSKVASKIGVKSQLDTANKKASAYVPTLGAFQERRDTNLDKVGLSDERQKVNEMIRSNKVTAGFQDWSVHGYQGLKETPVNFAAEQGVLVVGGAVGGAVIKGAGLAGRAGLTAIGATKAAGAVEPALNVGLGALALHEVSKVKSVEQGVDLLADFAVMGAGYKFGSKTSLKAYDRVRTIGSEKVTPESLINKNVLSGKEQFPLTKEGANAQDVLNSFKDPTSGEFIGYHATIGKLKPKVSSDVNRKTDVPGLYIAPVQSGASPHFLRLSGEQKSAFSTLTEGIKTKNLKTITSGILGTSDPISPKVVKLSLSEVGRLPENVRYSPEKAQKFLLSSEAPKGNAFLTPVLENQVGRGGRAEAEAIVVPETTLKETTINKKYFDWNGRRIEIKEYKTVEADPLNTKGEFPNKAKKLVTADELTKSYREEYAGSKGLISEIAYPLTFRSSELNYRPYSSSLTRASIPGEDRRAIDSRTIESRAKIPDINSRAIGSRTIDNQIIDNRIIDSRTIDNRIIDNRIIDSRTIDNRIIDNRIIDSQTIDNRVIDNRVIDNQIKDIEELTTDINLPDPFVSGRKLRKTKKKMLKNVYGDPFNTKTRF